jgi:lipoprotein-anchoring transpeptidase ErfK/SrfK
MVVHVSLADQTAHIFRGGELIGVTTVSTGSRLHRTPTGVYPILQKKRRHYSNLYDAAPMPYMQRLTWDGIALHGGDIPGYPASHGCVRLPHRFAKLLFSETDADTTVIISEGPPSGDLLPAEAAPDLALADEIALTDN